MDIHNIDYPVDCRLYRVEYSFRFRQQQQLNINFISHKNQNQTKTRRKTMSIGWAHSHTQCLSHSTFFTLSYRRQVSRVSGRLQIQFYHTLVHSISGSLIELHHIRTTNSCHNFRSSSAWKMGRIYKEYPKNSLCVCVFTLYRCAYLLLDAANKFRTSFCNCFLNFVVRSFI